MLLFAENLLNLHVLSVTFVTYYIFEECWPIMFTPLLLMLQLYFRLRFSMRYWHSGHHPSGNSAKEKVADKKAPSSECWSRSHN
jgi:hypothetical protein